MTAFTQGNMKAGKLTASEVVKIRQMYLEGMTQGMLCREFGVSIITIGRIVRGETWQKLPMSAKPLSEGELKASQERVLAMIAADTPTRHAPPSPLDELVEEGDAPEAAEEPTGLTALQKRAASFGLDIEKLLNTTEEN